LKKSVSCEQDATRADNKTREKAARIRVIPTVADRRRLRRRKVSQTRINRVL
jgi:hypothetical protein